MRRVLRSRVWLVAVIAVLVLSLLIFTAHTKSKQNIPRQVQPHPQHDTPIPTQPRPRVRIDRNTLLQNMSDQLSERLTNDEKTAISKCLENSKVLFQKAHHTFFGLKQEAIRHTHHTYLDSTSTVIDIGGNVGIDAAELLSRYNVKKYIVLEPLTKFFNELEKKFVLDKRVTLFNFGLGVSNAEFNVSIAGLDGDATSIFTKKSGEKVSIKIENATDFFLKIDMPKLGIDLVTINCEGCEFEVLEVLLVTGIVKSIRHLQFATHVTLPGISKDAYQRYCRIQSLLSRTHRLSYQYKFVWETWTRNDLELPK